MIEVSLRFIAENSFALGHETDNSYKSVDLQVRETLANIPCVVNIVKLFLTITLRKFKTTHNIWCKYLYIHCQTATAGMVLF